MLNPEWFGNNEEVCRLYEQFAGISHVWDDCIDQDKPIDRQQISEAFKIMLVDLPANDFYREHFKEIQPILAIAIAGYESSNRMHDSGDEQLVEIAHGLRYTIGHLFVYFSMQLIGYAKALEFMPEMWRNMMPERLSDYRGK
jgi:hypothetical protein